MDTVIADSKIRDVLVAIKGKGHIKDIYGRHKD